MLSFCEGGDFFHNKLRNRVLNKKCFFLSDEKLKIKKSAHAS